MLHDETRVRPGSCTCDFGVPAASWRAAADALDCAKMVDSATSSACTMIKPPSASSGKVPTNSTVA